MSFTLRTANTAAPAPTTKNSTAKLKAATQCSGTATTTVTTVITRKAMTANAATAPPSNAITPARTESVKVQDPGTQPMPLRDHVAHQADVDVVGEFVDYATADDLPGRREWGRLIEMARGRHLDVIVVWKLDRAFQSVVDGATTLEQLRACGCGIRSLSEPWIDTTTPMGEALFHITAAWPQFERRQIAERVKAGMARAEAEGKPVGGRPRQRQVTEHPQWPVVVAAIDAGHLAPTEAARKLHVRKATLGEALRGRPTAPRGRVQAVDASPLV
jgi:DNA invertase Pin-like site-specific DNA recombinase